ncbi:MAG: hypothetical protein LAO78_17800 [Acidobacteriia bacterium]|nr:hypothetical protein [Terriglobia bacterium]
MRKIIENQGQTLPLINADNTDPEREPEKGKPTSNLWDWVWDWDWVTQGSRKGHARATQGSPKRGARIELRKSFICNAPAK